MTEFSKRCSKCGYVHDAESWASLPYVGRADYEGELLEFRNCAQPGCGTTLAIDVTPVQPVRVLGVRIARAS